jgi:phosphatidylserine decarboxylase
MKDGLVIGLLSILPRGLLSRTMGRASRLALPRVLHRAFLRWYVDHYGVNLAEAAGGSDPAAYPTIASFFTRRLRDGARPLDVASDAVVSPCDGAVYAVGRCTAGRLPQSLDPAIHYAASDLLGGDGRWDGAAYCVIYLAPKDYHRVHSPREGQLLGFRYRPGRFWPVFPAATRRIRDLFARNERLVMRILSDFGEFALVMVGAFGVSRISTTFTDLITNTGKPLRDEDFEPPKRVARAEELGSFEMGSTVVLLLPGERVEWTVAAGDTLRLGARIGRILPPAAQF